MNEDAYAKKIDKHAYIMWLSLHSIYNNNTSLMNWLFSNL